MPTVVRDTAYFVQAIRQLTNMEDDPAVTDQEITDRASDAKSALYDLILASYEHYSVTSFDFTLAGGLAGSSVDLPTDFYKDVSLTLNPTTAPVTIHRLSSWVDRNNARRVGYTLIGNELKIAPAVATVAGDYQLLYTPLDLPFSVPTVVTVAYDTVDLDPTGGAVDGTLRSWFFPTAAFDASYVSGLLNMAGCSNSVNNDHFAIASVTDGTDIVSSVVSANPTSEAFGPGVTASVYLVPTGFATLDHVTIGGSNTWTFHGLDTSLMVVGRTVTIAGSVACDGVYTIESIVDASSFTTVESPGVFETFLAGVTVTFQDVGTIDVLPQIMQPWYEYIQVAAAIAVKDKIEQDTSDLEVRLQRLTQRITSMASNRMEEGGQVALPNRGGGFWDVDGWPYGG